MKSFRAITAVGMAEKKNLEKKTSIAKEILGYLNFSSGTSDPHLYDLWNGLFFELEKEETDGLWNRGILFLRQILSDLRGEAAAFRDSEQAEWVLTLISEDILPAYLEFHRDILFHQTADFLFNSFFMARICELVLQQAAYRAVREKASIVDAVISRANDFLGYRPIPTLEGEEKHEPNPHEWVAPVPLWLPYAGTAQGKYRDLIRKTIEILKSTDPILLRDAWFDPDKLDELAIDPRAFDFDHPINKRPNYYFGTWDPHTIDENGYFRRFIIHQVTLDAILERVTTGGKPQEGAPDADVFRTKVPWDQLLFEAASVLAGTILMGSGITGDHVQAHDSTVTLSSLMPIIASYRDRFYDVLIQKVPQPMRSRLEQEARRLFQPFGGARQDLNKRLAKRRADQLQRFHLARIYARMGYFKAAEKQTSIISVASARMICRIECLLTEGYSLADKGDYKTGVAKLAEIESLLHRGIDCGALPDPWSLLGFGAQYSLFPSADNVVHDHRVDDMINMLVDIFDLYSRLMKEAAAKGDSDFQAEISDSMSDLAGWWDQFGSTEVSGIDGFSGQEIWESATKVASALFMWQKAGNTSGDISFWSRHVERFSSPKAFVLLGEALLEKNDPVAAMSLMMYWLSNSGSIPLAENDYTFQGIAFRWMENVWREPSSQTGTKKTGAKKRAGKADSPLAPEEYRRRWLLTKNFLERLEANAGIYAEVPVLQVDPSLINSSRPKRSPFRFRLPAGFSEYADFGFDGNEAPEPMRNFVENLLPRPSFTLFELIPEEWMEEEAKRDVWFSEFASMPLNSSNIPSFVDFLRKSLVRILIKRIREPLKRPEIVELFREGDLLCRVIHEVLLRTGFYMIDHLLWEFRKRTDPSRRHHPVLFSDLPEVDETFFAENPNESLTMDQPLPADLDETADPGWLFDRYLRDFLLRTEWDEIRQAVADPDTDDFTLPEIQIAGTSDSGDDADRSFSKGEEDRKSRGAKHRPSPETESGSAEETPSDFGRELFGGAAEFGKAGEDDDEEEDSRTGIDPTYSAAYDNMSFHDSADDGIDDEMMDSGSSPFEAEDQLTLEMDRINDRLAFILCMMRLWKYAAGKSPLLDQDGFTESDVADARLLIEEWIKTAEQSRQKLDELLQTVGNYHIARPSGTSESLLEYDQQNGTKEVLLDRIIRTETEVTDTILFLKVVAGQDAAPKGDNLPEWTVSVTRVLTGLIHSDVNKVHGSWYSLLVSLEKETLLYIPTSRGGDPEAIVQCRCLQEAIFRLLEYLPFRGMLIETFELLRCVQRMEQNRPDGPGAITEFDKIVETAVRSITKMIADSSTRWRVPSASPGQTNGVDQALVSAVERANNVLKACWNSHSAHIRISSVEAVLNPGMWNQVKSFIQRYGTDLFTQSFLNYRNIRAILHQGGAPYLLSLIKMFQEGEELENGELLISDLAERKYPTARAAACLEIILEALAEHYSEYIDYNSTTTHSDHGEKLYMLLDMFRVLTRYERSGWGYKPDYWVHDALIASSHTNAAWLWEKGVASRSASVADSCMTDYKELSKRYGVWLPSIYERLSERFVLPLRIDRLCGMVSDAVRDVAQGESSESFQKLSALVERLAAEQSGIGFEIPEWLSELQDEVVRIQDSMKFSKNEAGDSQDDRFEDVFNPSPVVKPVYLTRAELDQQIKWCQKNISFAEKNQQ